MTSTTAKQEELQMLQGWRLAMQSRLGDPDCRWQLRMKFLEQAKCYIGVPYARRYHEPGTPEYNSPLFLDCCGLIRRVVRDLSTEFGFLIGPGNQAYQYDLLPITLPSTEHMKPGDLVFISGTYFNTERKRQLHDIVHVEIWLGDGERSLGARWHRGRVQIFDSYKFVSTSYGDMEYHFKSIETWLQGTCVSHCTEHKWASARALPGKKSVFCPEAERQQPADEDVDVPEMASKTELKNKGRVFRSQNVVPVGPSSQRPSESAQMDLCGIARPTSAAPREDEVEKGIDTEAGGKSQGQLLASTSLETSLSNLDLESESCIPPDRNLDQSKGPDELKKTRTTEVIEFKASRVLDSKAKNIGLQPSLTTHKSGKNSPSGSKMNLKVALAPTKRRKKTKAMTYREDQQLVGSSTADTVASNTSEGRLVDEARCKGNKGNEKTATEADEPEERKPEPQGPGPFFYIGGANGAGLVSIYCRSKGWQRIYDNKREDYKLKWCETKCRETYYNFKEGEQLLYQIPNNKVLTTKVGLLCSLREYERVMSKISKTLNTRILHQQWLFPMPQQGPPWYRILKMEDFFPESYRLDIKDEREAFFEVYNDKQIWICKPACSNQGRGIFLLMNQKSIDSLQAKLQGFEEDPIYKKMPYKAPQARIVQRYIHKPLLLEGKKFDVRSYLLIACTVPYVLFFGHGYVRLTCANYDAASDDLTAHLTNQYMQKKNPLYSQLKEETVWRMERFNSYVNEKFKQTKGLPRDWVLTVLTKMQQIMMQCFLAVKAKLECKLGYFDLIGCDFLIDENFKVWLLEMNANPALHTNCEVLKHIIPTVVNETLDLALEIFKKCLKCQRILPLETLCHFVLLYNGDAPGSRSLKMKNAMRPTKSQKSLAESTSPPTQTPTRAIEKPPKNPTSPSTKFSQRTVLSMPQVQISSMHSLYCYRPEKSAFRPGQVSSTCHQHVIKPAGVSESLVKPRVDDGSDKDKASTIVPTVAASKDTSYSAWLQQTFKIQPYTATKEDLSTVTLTSSQMVSLHLQSMVPDCCPCLKGYSKPLHQATTHSVAQGTRLTRESLAAAAPQGSESPQDNKKVSHRAS
ncbi:PREDICTED: inactive polyglycylase TTLL10 isoform X2 [Crocodylus porosus]|uniref:inactive polyglycylase TTLL10 isoform X2 n=1 Tax=Crocodylus porosus TaxID=8502 RepID=UPI00093B2442|nr:PREDICTED: inactive polyglycylase TTLL10 isoform X2 [Crocodylus porosus]